MLPSIATPEFKTIVPSTQQEIFFRPFLVKEEKILFMALQGQDSTEIYNAVKNILSGCIIRPEVDIDSLAMFDLEFLFLRLRAKSVGEEIELQLRHGKDVECNHIHQHVLNLEEVNVKFPDNASTNVQVTDSIGIKFKYPSVAMAEKFQNFDENNIDQVFSIIAANVECVYDQETVFDSFSEEEMVKFLEQLNKKQFESITAFFTAMPKLSHTIEWTCPNCGTKETVTIEGLDSFFM